MARRAISDKNKKLFTVLGGVAIVVVLILYFGVIQSPGSVPVYDTESGGSSSLPKIDTTIIEDGTLDRFDVWNSLPVEVGPTGKENPFSR